MRHIFIPTRDFGLADPVNSQLVLRFMDRLAEDPTFCPIVTVTPEGDPVGPRHAAKHLLTAAHWLGWKLYPAVVHDVIEDSQCVEMTAGSR